MQTQILPEILDTDLGQEADRILRACVHCGFCTATCPTYQELGDELDGPRGRIYQIKNMLEGEPPSREVQQHLDKCLTCLNCTTTCPSGVEYNHLIDLGREFIEDKVSRPVHEKIARTLLRTMLPKRNLFKQLVRIGQVFRPLTPSIIKEKIPARITAEFPTPKAHRRKVLIPEGCVQGTLTPYTDISTVRVLNQLGITAIRPTKDGCCGAVNQHLSAPEPAALEMKRNIDTWWTYVEDGIEAIILTASGCGLMVKDYAYHLRNDADYAEKAAKISALCKDLSEVITEQDMQQLSSSAPKCIAFHAPCTLQHGQKQLGVVENLLTAAGFELLPVQDSHSCCGSAGTYSVLQPKLSKRLRSKKLAALEAHSPSLIATANVGCQTHLEAASNVPIVHWVELFDNENPINQL